MDQITKLKEENILLRKEIDSLHKDWQFDSKRYQQLKEEHKSLLEILKKSEIKNIR